MGNRIREGKKELSLVETNDKGHLLDSAETLLTITKKMLSISQKVEKLYVYASMKNDQDTREAKYQEYQSKATALYVNFGESYAFYEPEFLKITKETYEQWLEILQELKNYDHMFERLFAKKNISLVKKKKKYWRQRVKSLKVLRRLLKFSIMQMLNFLLLKMNWEKDSVDTWKL
ncbi:Oligoendopeptidase F, plasmid [Lactococcus lactis]|nr:Oligoendopeptidase F, plasmid [Lactococcus lactis]